MGGSIYEQCRCGKLPLAPSPTGTMTWCPWGDSLTTAITYLDRVHDKAAAASGFTLAYQGVTYRANGVRYTATGGWSINEYLTHVDSPLVFDGSPSVPLYLASLSGQSQTPADVVTALLGTNDLIEGRTVQQIAADLLTFAQLWTAVGSKVGICKLAWGNATATAYDGWGGGYTRDQWWALDKALHAELESVIGNRETEGIYLIPLELSINAVSHYPADDPVHPVAAGYNAIGDYLWAWLARMTGEI